MRFIVAITVLLCGVPAFAEGSDAPEKSHRKCKTPQCHCNDTTSSSDCLDADACAKFCDDHGGAVTMHKRHRRNGHGEAQAAEEDKKF